MSYRWWVAAGLAACAVLPVRAAVEVGDSSPDVILPDQDGRTIDIAVNYGQRYIALAFYPKDDTAGCTLEAQSVNQALAELEQSGVVVYGVSVQDVASKKAFCNKHDLQQTMLSDPEKTVCEAFGTLNDKGLSNRVTVILDPSLTVRLIDRKVQVKNHAADIIAAVAQLREDDQQSALATLSKTPTYVAPGVSLRLPEGWKQTGTVMADPNDPQVGLRMGGEEAGAGGSTWISTHARGAALRADRALPLPDVDVRQYEFAPDGDGQVRCGVVWYHDGLATFLEGYAPAGKAGALARLLAEIVASLAY